MVQPLSPLAGQAELHFEGHLFKHSFERRRRNGARPVLAVEGAERDVLPALDVPRTPVIHQHNAEDMVDCIVHGDRLPLSVRRPNYARLSAATQSIHKTTGTRLFHVCAIAYPSMSDGHM